MSSKSIPARHLKKALVLHRETIRHLHVDTGDAGLAATRSNQHCQTKKDLCKTK